VCVVLLQLWYVNILFRDLSERCTHCKETPKSNPIQTHTNTHVQTKDDTYPFRPMSPYRRPCVIRNDVPSNSVASPSNVDMEKPSISMSPGEVRTEGKEE
jgi:hypothetical protein